MNDVPADPTLALPQPTTPPLNPVPQKVADAHGKLQVVISDEGFEAGRLNTVSIIVSNPFDVPVEILDIEAPKSSLLSRLANDQVQSGPPTERVVSTANGRAVTEVDQPLSWWARLRRYLGSLSHMGEVAVGSVSFAGVKIRMTESATSHFRVVADENAELEVEQPLNEFDSVEMRLAKGAKATIRERPAQTKLIAADNQTKSVVEPHCETVAYIPLVTTNWLFFKPIRMTLTYQLRYRLASNPRILTQVVSSGLDVRPPLRSIVIGSVLGALLGGVAQFTQQVSKAGGDVVVSVLGHAPGEIVQLLGAAIMGTIAAVALSRKTGAQSFITVEDFFGGFVIGVLIGYQGTSYFDSIIGHLGTPPSPPSSATPPAPR
jgi:hypothetical protein